MLRGCLVIHGFAGSVREVKPLADLLAEEGYIVSCPVLKGHTGRREDFGGVTYHDWLRSAEEALLLMRSQCPDITIIGFSMGGLIAIQLAAEYKVQAIVTINTPVYLTNPRLVFKNILTDIRTGKPGNMRRYIRSSGKVPFSAVAAFLKLLYHTRRILGSIKVSALILQALDDDVVHSRSADYLYQRMGSIRKSRKFYPLGGHVILLSNHANDVIKDVCSFLKNLPAADPPQS